VTVAHLTDQRKIMFLAKKLVNLKIVC